MKLYELKQSHSALEKLFNVDLPINISYTLSKVMKLVNSELQNLEEHRVKLIKKYGTVNEIDSTISISDSAKKLLFNNEYEQLLNLEINMDFHKLDLEQLGNIKLSAQDVIYLEPFVNMENTK